MNEKFGQWKEGIVDDTESVKPAEQSIDATIKRLEAEGWHYRGPVSGAAVYEAVAENGKEIKIVGTGTERFLFE